MVDYADQCQVMNKEEKRKMYTKFSHQEKVKLIVGCQSHC